MHVTLEITGQSPLLLHNIRLADPDDEIVRQIHAITAKRKKTETDRAEITKLEWYGGLYVGANGPVLPTRHVRKCVVEAAKVKRLGKAVERGFVLRGSEVPLIYDGPRDIDLLWEDTRFRHRTMVGVSGKRTPRTRPQFLDWMIVVEGELLEDVLSLEDLSELVEAAGIMEGVGDNRKNGYGRFNGIVKAA
jgi:hypothetical protein